MSTARILGTVFVLSVSLLGAVHAQTIVSVTLDGAPAAGASVLVDGRLRGTTDSLGNLSIDSGLLVESQTRITARLPVYEHRAFLGGHEDAVDGRSWVMRAYVTNLAVPDSGIITPFVVTNKNATQNVVLNRKNALIGLQVLVSVEWDMSEAEINELMRTFQAASHYLWNATDGQFILEQVKIADQGEAWDNSEFTLYADNTLRAKTTAGGYLHQNLLGQLSGSFISMTWRDSTLHGQGGWLSGGGYQSYSKLFIHELGHLAFDLRDEYGYVGYDTCTYKRRNDPATSVFATGMSESACVMDLQDQAKKFCSDHPDNPHYNSDFQLDDCWALIRGHYSDTQPPASGERWILNTPVTRNQIVGDIQIPVPGGGTQPFLPEWNTRFVVTNRSWRTPLCQPFVQTVTLADGTPAGRATVKLLYTSTDPNGHSWISQGKTFSSGTIAIQGAHVSDEVLTEPAHVPIATCPTGEWPQGATGTITEDLDGDLVLDPFDNCPTVYNPYLGTAFLQDATLCAACAADSDCRTGWSCVAQRCMRPACVTDSDCGNALVCQGSGASARCVGNLGQSCAEHADCSSGNCDRGLQSSHTARCMPNGDGAAGEICSQDKHCASTNCNERPSEDGRSWVPGTCQTNTALGATCSRNEHCASGYCDAGDGTSRTGLCMPNRNGQTGDMCSHDNQCVSSNCNERASSDGLRWILGTCQPLRAPLGATCSEHANCASGNCDRGLGSSHTALCMPADNGTAGQPCSQDRHCLSLNCSERLSSDGLRWIPGTCQTKVRLGLGCSEHHQCESGYCDARGGSNTNLCMPNNNGRTNDPCSHPHQCLSLVCDGLHKNSAGAWVPGTCR